MKTTSNVTKNLNKPPEDSFNVVKTRVFESVNLKLETTGDLERTLANWWCRHYSKPYKCKEVLEYTLEELLVEFLELSYFENPDKFKKELGADGETDEDEDWLKEQMGEGYQSKKRQVEQLEGEDNTFDSKVFEETHMTFGNN